MDEGIFWIIYNLNTPLIVTLILLTNLLANNSLIVHYIFCNIFNNNTPQINILIKLKNTSLMKMTLLTNIYLPYSTKYEYPTSKTRTYTVHIQPLISFSCYHVQPTNSTDVK